MQTKYFRFNMSDDREDTLWGYATGSGEFIGSDEGDISLDMIDTIAYDEATYVLRSWLKDCEIVTDTLEIDEAVAKAFSKGSTVAVFHYGDGEKYRMTIETTNDPLVDWEELKDDLDKSWDKKQKSTEDKYDRIYRLFKKAGHWVSGFDTKDHDGPNGEAVWIGDGGWKTVNYTRSDEDIINDIKKLEDD